MLDWDKLRVFHAVAAAGSFTHGGETLGLSQSAVSRQISALEESLGLSLFQRHARGLSLTEQGEMLYRTTRELFAKIEMVTARLTDTKERPSGDLRITAPVAFGSIWLTPRLKEFRELYPEIRINLLLSDFELDLSIREADVAIRIERPTQGDLIQRKILTINNNVYASSDYLARRGTPLTLEDLKDHDLITYGATAPTPIEHINWLANLAIKPPVLKINNLYGLLLAVEAGVGVAALPDYMVGENSRLVRILRDVAHDAIDAYFVYPPEQKDTKRIAVFRDFLLRKVAESSF